MCSSVRYNYSCKIKCSSNKANHFFTNNWQASELKKTIFLVQKRKLKIILIYKLKLTLAIYICMLDNQGRLKPCFYMCKVELLVVVDKSMTLSLTSQ